MIERMYGIFILNRSLPKIAMLVKTYQYQDWRTLLQVLDLGVEEGRLVVAVAGLAQQMEKDSTFAQEELARLKVTTNQHTASGHVTPELISDWVQGENDWLREELEEAERRLEEVLATVAGLEVEHQQHLFLQEVSCSLILISRHCSAPRPGYAVCSCRGQCKCLHWPLQ